MRSVQLFSYCIKCVSKGIFKDEINIYISRPSKTVASCEWASPHPQRPVMWFEYKISSMEGRGGLALDEGPM